jgi:hypothetical protein
VVAGAFTDRPPSPLPGALATHICLERSNSTSGLKQLKIMTILFSQIALFILILSLRTRLVSGQCNAITTFASSGSFIDISTMIRTAKNLEEFIGFNGPQIISSGSGAVTFSNTNSASAFEPKFCKIEFHGANSGARFYNFLELFLTQILNAILNRLRINS